MMGDFHSQSVCLELDLFAKNLMHSSGNATRSMTMIIEMIRIE